jgi:hypothetical protein
MDIAKLGKLKGTKSKLPFHGLRSRVLLYGVILLILGIVLTALVYNFGRYTSCGFLEIMCTRRLKTPGELFADSALWVFLIILGTLMIIVWFLSRSSYVQEAVRDGRQRKQQGQGLRQQEF